MSFGTDNTKEFWQAYWVNLPDRNILCIEHCVLEKENEKSYRFRIYDEQWEIRDLTIVGMRRTTTRKRTIRKERFYDEPKFGTREEAINYLIDACIDDIERCKSRLEKLPKVIEILEKIKAEEGDA